MKKITTILILLIGLNTGSVFAGDLDSFQGYSEFLPVSKVGSPTFALGEAKDVRFDYLPVGTYKGENKSEVIITRLDPYTHITLLLPEATDFWGVSGTLPLIFGSAGDGYLYVGQSMKSSGRCKQNMCSFNQVVSMGVLTYTYKFYEKGLELSISKRGISHETNLWMDEVIVSNKLFTKEEISSGGGWQGEK